MGALTEAMMRLRGEIGGLRHARVVMQHDLARQANERRRRVSALRAGFARDCAGAHRAWFGPTLSERRAEQRQQQQLAKETRAEVQREHMQQRLAEEAKAKAQREHEQQRLAEEAKAKTQREQLAPAKAKSRPLGHNPPKPVAAPAARPPVAPLAHAHRLPLKGSKKH
jgi:membrane protein involved in colicin uptake